MARTELLDPREAAEAEALFAKPVGGPMVPSGNAPNITITDQIITAQKVGVERDITKTIRNIKTLAAVAGEDWYYSFPVKKKGGGVDRIEGPSIKCAENVAREYGNCQVDCRSMDQGTSWMFYARFVDYETGFSLTRPFQADKAKVNINTKDPGRQQEIAFAIGASKATRNVIVHALETFTNLAFEEAKNNLVEKVGKKLDEYRKRVRDRLAHISVEEKRVEAMLGRKADEWLAPDVARVIAELKAISDGMASADETWPPPAPPEPKRGDFTSKGPLPEDAGDQSAGGVDAAPGSGEAGKPASDQPAQDLPQETDQGQGAPSGTSGGAEGQAAETSSAAAAGGGDSKSETAATQPARDWSIADGIVGQDSKLKAILAHMPRTTNGKDVDDLWAAHADFLEKKLGSNKRAEVRKIFDDRKAELRAGADE